MSDLDVIIVGGGAAGLSAAGALRRRGVDPLVIERSRRVGEVWERRYDRLRLHTAYSGLAHFPTPRTFPRYPAKDEYAAYLRAYASHFGLRIVAGCAARRVARAPVRGQPRLAAPGARDRALPAPGAREALRRK